MRFPFHLYLFKSLTILLRDVQSYCLGFWETDSRPSNFIFRFDIATAIAIFVSRFDTAPARWLFHLLLSWEGWWPMMIAGLAIYVVVVYPTVSFDLWSPIVDFIAGLMYV